jgi:hypothetical protein
MSDVHAAPEAAPTAIPDAATVSEQAAEPLTHADKVDGIVQDVAEKIEQRETAKQYKRSPAGQFASKIEAPQESALQESKPADIRHGGGPIAWKADMRQRFTALPPDLQDYIMEREQSAHGRISQLGESATAAQAVNDVAERYRDVLPANMPTPVVVEHLLSAHKQLETDPVGSLKILAESYGIDLRSLASGEAQPFDHMALAEVHLDAIREARAEARAEALVEQFTGSVEHWDDLSADIYGQAVALLQANPAISHRELLQKAHDRATRVSETFASRREAERAVTEREREQKAALERSKRATEAKRHISLNVRSSAAAQVRQGNWEDTLHEVAARIHGRG